MAHRRHPSHPRHNNTNESRERLRAQREGTAQLNQELRTHTPGRPRRKRPSLFLRRLRFVFFLFVLVGCGYLTYFALTAPELRVATVSVSGVGITPDLAIDQAKKQLVGQNWILAKPEKARKKLVSATAVKDVTVTRTLHWPPQMHIHIEERTPFVRVGQGNNWWVVDETGMPFRRAAQNDEHLFSLTGPKLSPEFGKAMPKALWQPSARLIHALNVSNAGGQKWALRRVYLDKNGFASLRLQGGMHDELLVRLGGDRWEEKLGRTRLALQYFERTGRRAVSLNLVSYNMPQWTPLRPTQSEGNSSNHSSSTGA